VILVKDCLSIDEQVGMYQQVNEAKNPKQVFARFSNGGTHPISLFYWNWTNGTGYPQLNGTVKPEELLAFGKMMFDRAAEYRKRQEKEGVWEERDQRHDYRCPDNYNPDSLISLLYPHNGTLHSHQDGVAGWVLGLTIGDSILFSFGTATKGSHNDGQMQVRLDSGDIILFNGQKLFHSVDKVIPDTAPGFWIDKTVDTKGFARFNLQFRETVKTQRFG